MQDRSSPSSAWSVAILAPLFPPAQNGGGPIKSLAAAVRSAPPSMEVSVVTRDRDMGAVSPLDVRSNVWTRWDRAWTYYASVNRPWALVRAYFALRSRRPDAIYLNSFFNVSLSILPQLLGRLGFWRDGIRLLAPRGEFGAAALAKSPTKKKIYLRLYRILSLDNDLVWHAANESEARDIARLWGKTAAVIVRENETSLPSKSVWQPSRRASDDHQQTPLSAIFLGRVVPHKGPLLLLRALADVRGDVALDVFGPEEDSFYAQACRDEIAHLPPNVNASLRGPISDAQVLTAIRNHDLMLFPTAGESFGHVIAESLFCCLLYTSPSPRDRS